MDHRRGKEPSESSPAWKSPSCHSRFTVVARKKEREGKETPDILQGMLRESLREWPEEPIVVQSANGAPQSPGGGVRRCADGRVFFGGWIAKLTDNQEDLFFQVGFREGCACPRLRCLGNPAAHHLLHRSDSKKPAMRTVDENDWTSRNTVSSRSTLQQKRWNTCAVTK